MGWTPASEKSTMGGVSVGWTASAHRQPSLSPVGASLLLQRAPLCFPTCGIQIGRRRHRRGQQANTVQNSPNGAICPRRKSGGIRLNPSERICWPSRSSYVMTQTANPDAKAA